MSPRIIHIFVPENKIYNEFFKVYLSFTYFRMFRKPKGTAHNQAARKVSL